MKRIDHSAGAVLGIGDVTTVSNGPDDGTNDTQACAWYQPMRHGSTQQAIDNLISRLPPTLDGKKRIGPDSRIAELSTGLVNIGGHGNIGLLETGMGQTGAFDENKIIMTWNGSAWVSHFQRLGTHPFVLTSIYSCDTGADDDGADLLFAIAKATGRPVRARTGLTIASRFSDGHCELSFENGSTWQTATPTTRPTPIKPPSPPHPDTVQVTIGAIGPNAEVRDVDIGRVRSLAVVVRRGFGPTSNQAIQGADAVRLTELLFGSEPFYTPGQLLGVITAEVDVGFDFGERHFVIFNDRIVRDTISGLLYYVTGAFRQYLRSLS